MHSSKSDNFFDEVQREFPEKQCGLKDALREMDPEYAAQVKEALLASHRKFPGTAITETLRRKGYRVNEWQIRNCRKRCSCGELEIPRRED